MTWAFDAYCYIFHFGGRISKERTFGVCIGQKECGTLAWKIM